jgi:PTS system nitrogen regulatory IIA component
MFHEGLVALDLEAKSRDEVFKKLVCLLSECDCMESRLEPSLCEKLDQRERIGSTSVGKGFALPHAYFEQVKQTYLIFGRLTKPISFGLEGGAPVDKVFLLVGPKRNETEHLMILARLSRFMRDDPFLEKLNTLKSGAEFMLAIREVETRH